MANGNAGGRGGGGSNGANNNNNNNGSTAFGPSTKAAIEASTMMLIDCCFP